MSRPIVIGAGPNGLVCAAYLAKAGLRPIVLEGRDEVGGCAVTHELAPGVRGPALSHTASIGSDIARDLGLDAQGLELRQPAVSVAVPTHDGRALVISRDVGVAAQSLAGWSARDAQRWPSFVASVQALSQAMRAVLAQVPPSIDTPSPGELWELLQLGRILRGLGRAGLYDLLRWGPMPVADLAAEWFESPALRAAICARGVFGMQAGPRSAGTTASWLLQTATEGHPTGAVTVATGGPAALSAALAAAATGFGAEIRRQSRVDRIDVDEDGVHAVVIEGGEALAASAVFSSADPKHTFLRLIDPGHLQPSFRQQILNYRSSGVVAKVNLVVDALPRLRGLEAAGVPPEEALAGRILVGDDPDDIERAFDATKYGRMSERPWLEVHVPTLTDPTLAADGRHVLSIYAQYFPYRLRESDWDTQRDALGRLVLDRLAGAMPGVTSTVVAAEVLTPLDLERRYGLTGGHIFHGEHALDQLYAMRPVLGWAQHRTPIRGLYLCGAGTHPGGGVTGAPGAHAARTAAKDLKRGRS